MKIDKCGAPVGPDRKWFSPVWFCSEGGRIEDVGGFFFFLEIRLRWNDRKDSGFLVDEKKWWGLEFMEDKRHFEKWEFLFKGGVIVEAAYPYVFSFPTFFFFLLFLILFISIFFTIHYLTSFSSDFLSSFYCCTIDLFYFFSFAVFLHIFLFFVSIWFISLCFLHF